MGFVCGGSSVGAPPSTGSDHRLGATIGAGAVVFEPLDVAGAGVRVCAGAGSVALGLPVGGSIVVGNAGCAGASGAKGR